MTSSYDAVLIGAGHNSLACAAHLAAKGWRVCVVERSSLPGGAVKTMELTTPGFRHDWGAMNLSLFAGSPFFKQYGEELGRHGLEFAPVQKCFSSVFPDGKWMGVGTDVDATRRRIAALNPADADRWDALLAGFPDRAGDIFALLGSPMTMRALATFGFKVLRRKGLAGSLDLIRFLLSSPRRWLTETFASAELRATLAAWGMHLDFAPDIAGGAMFPYLEAMANESFGMVLGKGGADAMIASLVRMIEARGGTIECNAEAAGIVHKHGRATGVRLADGRILTGTRAVIANVAPGALPGLLGGTTGDARVDAGLSGYAHAPGTLMIHLAMEDLPDWQASAELREFAYVHLAPSLDQMARTYQQARAGLLPDEPIVVVGQPTAIDPTRAPDGKHILWMQLRMVPAEIRGDAAGQIAATDWDVVKEAMADRALDILDRYAPGVRAKIIARRVVSPLELQADNPNLVGGDQVCGSHHLSQNFLFRPVRGHADGSTPIRNLHLTGAGVWPGAGVGAGAGFLLARRLAGN
ncbi:phytoene desaturase family protein [Solirhodobacter olei]|uniref:phytoene desaturase family protein n=1 Tax=Solirhodobacter olei TaxID=2493082 RepID=UPI000FD8C146|nr:NAD(P)/FAD-dependent oxidoreductase [Solirhodobacter olei]